MLPRLLLGLGLGLFLLPPSLAHAVNFRDWFVPNKQRDVQWRFDFSTGVGTPLVVDDPHAGIELPLYVGFDITLTDEFKTIRIVPFAGNMSYLQNGRGRQFDSVSYGQTVGLLEGEVFVHRDWHFLYEAALFRGGLEHHLGPSSLQMALGVRRVLWAPSRNTWGYGRNHLHLTLRPLSVVWLGRLDLVNEFGTERLVSAFNGMAGLEGALTPVRWLTLEANTRFFLNYNLKQSMLWRTAAGGVIRPHRAVEIRLTFQLQVPLRSAQLRTNVYAAYFLEHVSFSTGIQLLWLISESKRGDA